MAKDNNEEPEENDDNLFDDDDFGLPDLEYDELDDDLDTDDSDDIDSGEMEFSLDDDTDDASATEDDDLSIDLDNVDFDAIDAVGDDDEEDEIDVFAGIGETLDDDDTVEPESEDFSTSLDDEDDSEGSLVMGGLEPADESDLDDDDEDFSSILNDDDDDSESELGTLDDDDAEGMAMVFDDSDDDDDDFSDLGDFDDNDYEGLSDNDEEYAYVGAEENKEGGSGFMKYLIIGIAAIALLAVGLIFFSGVFDDDPADKPKLTNNAKKTPAEKPVVNKEPETSTGTETGNPGSTANSAADKPATKPAETKPKPVVDNTASAANPGEVTRLSGRNGKAYVIVASFIDSDLAEDHARKLAAEGKSPYVIPPFGKYKYSRVGIAEFDSFEGAAANLDNYKSEYGSDIWALRY